MTVGSSSLCTVEKGKQPSLLAHIRHHLPLLPRRVDASRVMRAGMQQDDVPRGRVRLERAHQVLKVEPLLPAVPVRVPPDRHPDQAPDVAVVHPAGVREPDRRRLQRVGQEARAEEVGPRARDGLQGAHAGGPVAAQGPEEDVAGGGDEGGVPRYGEVLVTAWVLARPHHGFGLGL